MTPTQQIIPAPRSPEGRNSGRHNALEVARPVGPNRIHAEPTVNYAALLRRHRFAVAVIIGSVLVLSVLYTLVAPKSYKTEAILEVNGQNEQFMNTKDVEQNSSAVSGDGYIETQTKLMKSPPVIQRTAQILGPKVPAALANRQGLVGKIKGLFGKAPEASPEQGEAIVAGILGGAKVKVDGGSDLLTLDITGPDPQLIADAANELTQQFILQAQELRGFNATNTNKFLTTQMADARKKLQDSENALQDYARQSNIVIPNESQESVAADKLRQIQADLAKAESDVAESRAQVETSRANPTENLPQVQDDPTLRDQQARLADLRRQRADLSVTLTPANYKIQQLDAQIAALEQQSAHERVNVVKKLGVQNSEINRRKQLLAAAYQAQLGVVSDQSVKEVRYNILKKEVDANRDIYQSMLQRVKQATIVSALKSSDVRVVSPAMPPGSAYRPSIVLNLGLGLLLGLGLRHLLHSARRAE